MIDEPPSEFADVGLKPLSRIPKLKRQGRTRAVEGIKKWFLENFEDPAHSTPHDSSEGGYLYIHGGPYDTRDVVETIFGQDVPQETLEVAIEELEYEGGPEWAPSGHRHLPPEDDYDEMEAELDPRDSPAVLHMAMLQRLDELEPLLEPPSVRKIGMGHNNPPEELWTPSSLDNYEVQELRKAVALLRTQPVQPQGDLRAVYKALGLLNSAAWKVGGYVAKQADNFTTEAAKSAGKQAGKWLVLGPALAAAAAATAKWLGTFPPF